ncbi:MAG TPA: PIN domain-containing protein [Candidatus Dormibacteraeota bacterium]|nr:PIN domain-containing protein [Candidatus Dormibacteraeota bacterium]
MSRNLPAADPVVIETSALLDLMLGNPEGAAVAEVLRGRAVHLADHSGWLVARALGILAEGRAISAADLARRYQLLADAPFLNHPATTLLPAALGRLGFRLGDALSVELSQRLGAPLITTDSRLAAIWPRCWLVAVPRSGLLTD